MVAILTVLSLWYCRHG